MGHANSVMNDERGSWSDIPDRSSSNPVTRVIKVTLPTPTISLYNHSYIHTRIHSICPCLPDDSGPESPGDSGTKPSHVQRNASQCSVLRHEAAVASFDMSNDRPGFEGRPTKGSRPPHVKQSQGRKTQMSPVRPSPSLADRVISTFSFDPKPLPSLKEP